MKVYDNTSMKMKNEKYSMVVFYVLSLYVCLVISTSMCRKYFRKYFEWYSVQNWRENIKEIDFYKFIWLLDNEIKF